jgi:ABC-2 type transport system permease protein
MLKRVFAFLKKDFLIESSYKLPFLFNIFSVLISILAYFFIDKLFGHRMTEHLEEFGVNYFSYVLLSMAFFSYIGVGLGSFANRIRLEQMQGTLETIFLTPIRTPTILISLALWNICFATLDTSIYIVSGIFLFNIDFSNINVLSTFVILLLTMISFSCLGIFSASFIMIFKRGNPVNWLINSLEGLIGGVYFPVSVMPGWLQFLARFFPITYAIRAMELSVYRGFSLNQLSKEISLLFLLSSVLLPLSFASFKFALKKARRQGSLLQY